MTMMPVEIPQNPVCLRMGEGGLTHCVLLVEGDEGGDAVHKCVCRVGEGKAVWRCGTGGEGSMTLQR